MNTSTNKLELLRSAATDDRRTTELCAAERNGLRCARNKGHDDEHEALTLTEPIRWR